MEVSKDINNDDPEKAIDFRFMVDGSVPLPQRIVEYAVNRPIASQRQAHVRMITAALEMVTLNELTKILEILEEITKDVEPESRLSLAKQLPLIVQTTLKLAPSVDEACGLICEYVHPAMEFLVKDEGDEIGKAAVESFVRVLKLTVHETTYDIWDILERCVHSNREDVRCRAAGLLAGSVAHLTSSALATTKRKATASVLKRGSFAVPLADSASRRRGRPVAGVPAMPAFSEEGDDEENEEDEGGEGGGQDADGGDSSENEDIVPPLLSEIGRSIKRGTLAPGASGGGPGGTAASRGGKRGSITAGATPDDLPEVIRLDFLGQAAQFYMTLLNDMDPGVQAAALAPSVANRMMTMILLMRGGDSMDTLPFVPEDDPPEYDDGYPPYAEVDEEDWSPEEDDNALQLQRAWLRNVESMIEIEKACMVKADAEAGGGQSFTSVLVDEDALSDFEDEWVEGGSDLDFCDGLEEGADPALDDYFQDAWCDVARDDRGEVALTRALRRLAAEESPTVRAAVAQAVPAVADSMPDIIRRRQLRHLLVRLACDEHSDVRVAAAAAAGRMITAFAVEASLTTGDTHAPRTTELKQASGAMAAVGGSTRLSDSEAARLTFREAALRCGIPLSLLAVYILSTQGLRCDRQRISTVISGALAFTRLGGRQRLQQAAAGLAVAVGETSPTISSSSTSATSSDSEDDSEASRADSDGSSDGSSDEEFRARSRSSTLRGRNRQEAEQHAEKNAAAVRGASRKASVGSRPGDGDEGETEADFELFEHHDKLQHSAAYTLPALVLSLGPGRWADLLCPWSPAGGVRLTPSTEGLPSDVADCALPRVSPLSLATATAGVMRPMGQHLAVTATSLAGLHEAVRETRFAQAALRPLTSFLRCMLATERFRWPTLQQVALEVLPRVLQWTQHATHVALTGSLYPMSLPVRCSVWRTRWKLACQLPALALVMSPRAAMSRLLPLCNVLLRDPVSVVRRDAAKATAVLLSRLAAVATSAQAVVDAAAAGRELPQEGTPGARGGGSGRRLRRPPAPLSLHMRRQSVGSIPPVMEAQARDLANTLGEAVQRTAKQLHSLAATESHLDHKSGFVKVCQYLCYPRALRSIVAAAMGTLAYQHSNLPNTMVLLTSPAPGTPGGATASPGPQGARRFPGSPALMAGGGGLAMATPPTALLSPSVPRAQISIESGDEDQSAIAPLRTPVRPARASVASNVLSTDQQFLVEWEGLSLSLGIPCPALGLTDTLEGREQDAVNTTLSVAGWLLGGGEGAAGGTDAAPLTMVGGTPEPGSTEASLIQSALMSPGLTHPDASVPSSPAGDDVSAAADGWSSSVSRDSKAGIACILRPESAVWSRRTVIMQAVGAISKKVFQEHFCAALGDMLEDGRVRHGGYLWRQALELLSTQRQGAIEAAVAAQAASKPESPVSVSSGTEANDPDAADAPVVGEGVELGRNTGAGASKSPPAAPPTAPLSIPSIAVQVTPAHGRTLSAASVEGLLASAKEEHINARVPMVAPAITPPSASPLASPTAKAAVTPGTAALASVDVAARASVFGGRQKGSTGTRRTSSNNVVSLVSPRVTRPAASARRTSGRALVSGSSSAAKSGALQTPASYLSSARNQLRTVDNKLVAAGRMGGRLAAAAKRAKASTAAHKSDVDASTGARRSSNKTPSAHRRTGTDVDVMTSLTFDPGAMADDEAAMDALVNKVIAQNEAADEIEEVHGEPEQGEEEEEEEEVASEPPQGHRRSHSLGGRTRKRVSLIDEGTSAPAKESSDAHATVAGATAGVGALASIKEGTPPDTPPSVSVPGTGIAALGFWKEKDKKGGSTAGIPPLLPARRPSASAGSVLKLEELRKQFTPGAKAAAPGAPGSANSSSSGDALSPDAVARRARRSTSNGETLGAVTSKIRAWQTATAGGAAASRNTKPRVRKASGTNLAHHKYLAMLQASSEEYGTSQPEQPATEAAAGAGAVEPPAAPPRRPPSAPSAPTRAPPGGLSSVDEEGDAGGDASPTFAGADAEGFAGLKHRRRSLGALSFMQAKERSVSEGDATGVGGSSSRRGSRTGSRRNSYAAPQGGHDVRAFAKSVPYAQLSLAQPGDALVLDWSAKEQYLNDEEFQRVLGCTKAEFEGLPRWKQHRMKRDVSLF